MSGGGEGSITSMAGAMHPGRETGRTVATFVALLASALPLLYFGFLARPGHDESSVAPASVAREKLPPGTNSRQPASDLASVAPEERR
jgi:hypothetical protein